MLKWIKWFLPLVYMFLVFYLLDRLGFGDYVLEWFFLPVSFCLIISFVLLIMFLGGVFNSTPKLREILKDEDIGNVDALLRRSALILNLDGLTAREKEEVMEGKKALSKLFYPQNATDQ